MRRIRTHRIRYRPGNRRGLRRLRACLVCAAVVATLLSVQVIVRSLRTAALNRQLVRMHTVDGQSPTAEVAAPASEASYAYEGGEAAQRKSDALTLSMMTMPDGSAIRSWIRWSGIP